MNNKIFLWIVTFFALTYFVSAECVVNQTFNDTHNKYSFVDCGSSSYIIQNSVDTSSFFLVLLPLILCFLLLYWVTNMSDEHNILKIFIYLSPIPLFYISAKYAIMLLDKFYIMSDLVNNISEDLYILGLIFFIIVAYFLLYLIVKAINIARQDKESKLEY